MSDSMTCIHQGCGNRTLDPSGLCYLHHEGHVGIFDENDHLLSVIPPTPGAETWSSYSGRRVVPGQERWDMYETDNPRPPTRTERLRRLFDSVARNFRKPVIQPRGYDAFVPYKTVQGPTPVQGFAENDASWLDADGKLRPSQAHLDAVGDMDTSEPPDTDELWHTIAKTGWVPSLDPYATPETDPYTRPTSNDKWPDDPATRAERVAEGRRTHP